MRTTSSARRNLAALAVAAALCVPLAACQPGAAGPASGHTVSDRAGSTPTPARADPDAMPDHPERLGILRWCYPNHSALDVVERQAARRHCATLRGE